jgi:hypothetical protein
MPLTTFWEPAEALRPLLRVIPADEVHVVTVGFPEELHWACASAGMSRAARPSVNRLILKRPAELFVEVRTEKGMVTTSIGDPDLCGQS